MNSNGRLTRLALSYLAIIMASSLMFCGIIYIIVSSQIHRSAPQNWLKNQPLIVRQEIIEQYENRNTEARTAVIVSLAVLNLSVLIIGAWAGYFLAKRTLAPIERAIRSQARFVSDASHELKTPLTALKTINEVVLRKKSLSEDKARETMARNVSEIDKMQKLIDGLLQLSKSGGFNLQKTNQNLAKLVDGTIESLRPIAEVKQIKVVSRVAKISRPIYDSAVAQILKIYLENAITHSPVKGQIVVEFKDGVLRVTDQGAGIAVGEQARIFERFYQIDQARTRSDGSGHGLGLAIVRNICEQCGYKYGVKSKPGKGATFFVVI